MRRAAIILLLIGTCGGLAGVSAAAEVVPLPRPRPPQTPGWTEPHSFREAAGPDFKSEDVTDKPSDCDERLGKMAVIAAMPRLIGPGRLRRRRHGADRRRAVAEWQAASRSIRRPICAAGWRSRWRPGFGTRRCRGWRRRGTSLRTVDTYDDFDCRGRNRVIGARMSEHGKGNAVDVRSLTLVGRRVIGLTDIMTPKDLRLGLRESACGRFTTVLGPGSTAIMKNTIHFDLAERSNGYRICQWAVREPPKPELVASADKPVPNAVAQLAVSPAPVPRAAAGSRRKL